MARPEPTMPFVGRRARRDAALVLLAVAFQLAVLAAPAPADGPYLVHDLGVGVDYPWSFIGLRAQPVAMGGALYFFHDDGVHGEELWRSDGTAAGTWLVRDLSPGPESAGIGVLEPGAGHLFFAIAGAPAERTGLWVSDGTAAGTQRLSSLPPEGGWQSVSGAYRRFNSLPDGTLLYTVAQPNHDIELWRSDGTVAGTFFLRRVGYGGLNSVIVIAGDSGYLVGQTPEGATELVRSDGTVSGTELVPLPDDARPYVGAWASSLGGRLFLAVWEPATGAEPWVVDGLVATPLADLRPGPESSAAVDLAYLSGIFSAVAGGEVVFLADDGSGAGLELWATDLTPAGTRRISDLTPGEEYPGLPDFASRLPPVALGGQLLLPTWDPEAGVRLWRADPAADTTSVVRQLGWQSSSLQPPRDFPRFLHNPPPAAWR